MRSTSAKRITLNKSEFGKDIFWDELLIKLKAFPSGGQLIIDISDCSWMHDFQLSSLPFILFYLKQTRNIDVTVEYPTSDLFYEDDFLNYLYASGFFNFIESSGIKTHKHIPLVGFKSEDPLIKFQCFRNITNFLVDPNNNESRRLLYELSSSLRAIFEQEIFIDYTTASEKVTKTIAKELVENINLHSHATHALLRFKYLQKSAEIQRLYGEIPVLTNFLKSHRNSSFFVISISDNGLGIISTLKEKYKSGVFLINENESRDAVLSETNSWWLKRAFSKHRTADKDVRSRRGLIAILDTICKYNGFLYLRNEDAAAFYNTYNGTIAELNTTLHNPRISGTHFFLIFPAEQKKEKTFSDSIIYSQSHAETVKEVSRFVYREFDISFLPISPISGKVSYKYPNKMFKILSEQLSTVIEEKNSMLVVDFSNAVKERLNDYAFILARLVQKFGPLFGQFCVLRNVLRDAIEDLRQSQFADALVKSETFAIVFSTEDRFSLIGIKNREIENDMQKIFRNTFLKVSELRAETRRLIESNRRLIQTAILPNSDEVAFFIDFSYIFADDLKQRIARELDESGALITGHFHISPKVHVNKYLIAPFMFHNPTLCRLFAKELFKKLYKERPDILLTYSATGLIMYYYLRNYYLPNLEIMLVTSPQDLSLRYGEYIRNAQKVLVLTDVKCTGSFIARLADLAIKLSGSSENIVAHVAIFDLYKDADSQDFDITTIYDEVDVDARSPEQCTCREAGKSYVVFRSDISIDLTSGVPTVRQKETSNLTELLRKRALTNTDQLQRVEDRICDHGIAASPKGVDGLKVIAGDDIEVCVDTEGECCSTNKLGLKDEKMADADKDYEVGNGNKSVNSTFKKKELRSRIDDDKLIDLELADYWKSLDNAFQIGHVERGDTHFEHYDKPERLLFRRRTLFELEAYIKEFVWSYKEEEIHYIIYNWDLTAALLAHIVASRFLRKPKVIEAVKFSDGSLVLPSAISKDLNKKNVLLVDDAINTGTTMLELIGLIRIYGGKVAGIFTITNRTSPEVEMTLKNLVPKVACAYRFDLATYRRSRCNLCAYQKLIEAKIRSSATTDFFEYLNSKLNVMAVKPFEM